MELQDCPTHSGRDGENARIPLDDVMRNLPNNQAGEGRHKCPYCAFEVGRRRGQQEARQEIIQMITSL